MKTQQDIDAVFLALAVWREARGESDECKAGVAGCIMNRVERPGWWGKNVMDVLFKKWQFSSFTDPRDKQLTTWPKSDDQAWQACVSIAECAVSGILKHPAPGADSYFDISIDPPVWATADKFVRQIGRVKFYNMDLK
jgi:N-acetylmuramoyl-L-alanine amidase